MSGIENQVERVHITPVGDTVKIMHGELPFFQKDGVNYRVDTLQSILDLVRSKGSAEKTIIFYNDTFIHAILDDTINDRTLDTARYNFSYSIEFLAWKEILGDKLIQKDLIEFLRNHPGDVVGGIDYLISMVSKLKVVTEIVGDYNYDDNNNVSFFFKSKDGEGQVKLPAVIQIQIPVFRESSFVPIIDIELQLNKPKSENEKPTIQLTCQKLKFYHNNAVKHEVSLLKETLSGFMIFAGAPTR